jgi:hypothetical protein
LFAIALVFGSIIFIFNIMPQEKPVNIPMLKKTGYYALEHLDNTDELRQAVYENDRLEISNRLKGILPSNIDIHLDICTTACNSLFVPNRTVVSIDYYISGYRSTFVNKKLKLWLWEKF